MQRLLVTETGDSFGRFNDGSTIFLSFACDIVVETDKNNKQITHVINFINDSLKQKVEQMVNIRNTYFSPICLPQFMKQNKNAYKKLLHPITECIWNQNCQQNIKNNTIESFDRHTTLKLHKNNHMISIQYPINVSKEIKVTSNGETLTFYNHIQHTQLESIHNYNNINWSFPLHLIQTNNNNMNPKNTLHVINKTPLPQLQIKPNSLQKTMSKLSDECMKAIEYFHCNCSDHGIPPNQIVIVDWTFDIIYRIFNKPNYLVEIFILLDNSYLIISKNKQFMYQYIPNRNNNKKPFEEYIYSMNAIPPIPPNTKQETKCYNLENISENAVNLLKNAYEMNAFKQTATFNKISLDYTTKINKNERNNDKIYHLMSNKVNDYYIHPKFGEFTYYVDKRVKIYFHDRTMLELNSEWSLCTIITKYGEEIKNINCNNPIKQFAKYIKHALNYANWCSLSKKEQLYIQQNELKIRNDIQKQIDFSNRLIQTQQIAENEFHDDSILDTNTNIENENLIESIQNQLNNIDKLLQ